MDLEDLPRRVARLDAALRPAATREAPLDDLAAGLRTRLLHLPARDQDGDTRDELPRLRDLPATVVAAGVDADPVLAEVAALASDIDRYGMGSIRRLLIRCVSAPPGSGQRGTTDI